jgi:hypothetical protein
VQATALPELLQAFFVRNSAFPTTLFAATCQQFTAVFGTHTLAETMFVFAGAAGRLECTFHRVIKKLAAFQKSERKGKTNFLTRKRFLGKSFRRIWRFTSMTQKLEQYLLLQRFSPNHLHHKDKHTFGTG